MRLQKSFFLIASCMLSRAQIDGENQGLLRRKTFYLFFFLLSFAEISLHRILGTDRFRARSMIISSYNMLTALPARLQLLRTYTQYGFIRNGVIISVLRHCLVVSQTFKTPKISSLFFLKLLKILVLFLIKAFLIRQYCV